MGLSARARSSALIRQLQVKYWWMIFLLATSSGGMLLALAFSSTMALMRLSSALYWG
ncbi:hypothetical protein D3C77_79630 [compost metagenome]